MMIPTRVDPSSEAFHTNASYMRGLVEELKQRLSIAALGGGDDARRKHTERGKLLPRDRIEALLDPGSPWLELSPLAAEGMYEGGAPAAGIVTGIGRIHGSEVVVVANDGSAEGSYGTNGLGVERPEAVGIGACDLPQALATRCD